MAIVTDLFQKARHFHQSGDLAQAESLYRQILRGDPLNAGALHMLGLLAYQTGHAKDAIILIGRAVNLNPKDPYAQNNLGNVLQEQGQLNEAAACFRLALETDPHHAAAHYNLGNVLRDQDQPAEAALCYQEALRLNPNQPNAHNNLGSVLKDQGKPLEAIPCFQQALRLNPRDVNAHCNLGNALVLLGKLADADACYRQALAIDAGHKPTLWNRGIMRLLQGHFEEGWPHFELRWSLPGVSQPTFPQPRWDGSALEGKTVLVYSEMVEQQNQQMMDQNARQTSIQNMDATAFTRHVREHTATTPNGVEIYTDPLGRTHVLPNHRQEAREVTAQQLAERDRHEDDRFITALEHVEKTVDIGHWGENPDKSPRTRAQEIRARMLQRGFSSSDLGEHRATRQEGRMQTQITSQVNSQMEREAASPNPPAWARSPEAREDEQWTRTQARLRQAGVRSAAPAPEPVSPDSPTTAQRETAATFRSLTRRLAQIPDGEQRIRDAGSLGRAQALFQRYGSTSAMPPSLRREVDGLIGRLNESLPAAPSRQQPSQEAPAQPPVGSSNYQWSGLGMSS